jgi:hypothetical protein
MKRLLIATALIAASSPAFAGDFFLKPYVGADYDYVHVNYKDNIDGTGLNGDDAANDTLHGFDLHAGVRVHKYLGFEGSYIWTADAKKDNVLGSGINTKVNVRGGTLDAMGYLPIDNKVELIGTVGISRLKANLNLSAFGASASGGEWETKGRIGGGAQYWLSDNINARALVRYQGADFSGIVDNAIIATIGLNYQF